MGIPRSIRLEREQKRLDAVARERGFENSAEMLYTYYIIESRPIERIAKDLFTPMWTLRKRFDDLSIPLRTRGGRNNVHVEITRELVYEACRDGLPATAERLGVEAYNLGKRLLKFLKDNPE